MSVITRQIRLPNTLLVARDKHGNDEGHKNFLALPAFGQNFFFLIGPVILQAGVRHGQARGAHDTARVRAVAFQKSRAGGRTSQSADVVFSVRHAKQG